MYIERQLGPGVMLVLSKDEQGFKRVLEEIGRATRVAVLTFNFAKQDSELADLLLDLPDHLRLDVITNIPKRMSKYFDSRAGRYMREGARANIKKYVALLDPLRFKPKTTIRFNLQNHAKIIATDTCAYVGSANFTGESADNYECGTLLTTPEHAALALELFDQVAADSILNPGSDAGELAVALKGQASALREILEELRLSLFTEADHGPGGKFYYDPQRWPAAAVDELDAVLRGLDDSAQEARRLYEARGHGLPLLDRKRIRHVLDLITEDARVRQLAEFDADKFAQMRLEENSKEAFDEALDYYAQAAADEAEDRRVEIAEAAHGKVADLMRTLQELESEVEVVERALLNALVAFEEVDNTR